MRALLPLAFLLAASAQAGQIHLAQTLTAGLEGDTLHLTIQVENQGEETALDVQPVVHFLGRTHLLPALERLEARTFYRQTWETTVPGPGDYGLLVDLRYHGPHAGFSLPTYVQVPAESRPGTLDIGLGRGERGPFLLLKNHGEVPLPVTLTVLAPWELGLAPPPREVTVPAGGERLLPLHFSTLDVIHQSTALVHALADYHQGGRHRIAHAALDLHAGRPLAAVPWSLVASAFALLLALLLMRALRRRYA